MGAKSRPAAQRPGSGLHSRSERPPCSFSSCPHPGSGNRPTVGRNPHRHRDAGSRWSGPDAPSSPVRRADRKRSSRSDCATPLAKRGRLRGHPTTTFGGCIARRARSCASIRRRRLGHVRRGGRSGSRSPRCVRCGGLATTNQRGDDASLICLKPRTPPQRPDVLAKRCPRGSGARIGRPWPPHQPPRLCVWWSRDGHHLQRRIRGRWFQGNRAVAVTASSLALRR